MDFTEANMYALMLLEEAGPNTELGWMLAVLLGFFLLMVIVGWLVSSRKVDQVAEVQPVAQIHHEEKSAVDDLVKLEGIGPKVARVLNDSGITTFEALANANPANIQKTLSAAGLQMMNPQGWIEQARLAANGDWTSLEKLQSELKGGRRK
jgi:hypothetical protein